MSEQLRESLSAMLDDEATELELRRVLRAMEDDAALGQAWQRYHLTRAAMTDQATAYLHLDISSRVRAAVETGHIHPAQQPLKQRLLRPLASVAVAASVAATVVIGGQQLARVGSDDPYGVSAASSGGVSPVGMINSVGAVPVQASYGTAPIPVLEPATRTAYQELARQRMQMYMQEHAEHAALNSPQGLIPFARVAEIHE